MVSCIVKLLVAKSIHSDFEVSSHKVKVVWRVAAIHLSRASVIFKSYSALTFSE